MQKDKMNCEVEQLETVEENKKEKSYSRPELTNLGMMRKVTLGKTSSAIDEDAPGSPGYD